MARRATTKTAAPKTATSASAPVATTPAVEITNDTMVECRSGCAGNLIYMATMDLQLPEDLKAQWGDYLKLQTQQGMPMADCAGQVVRRFTYTVTNYPDVPDGVQVNLFTCGDRLVGGDIIATGENGFQTGLTFPEK